MVLPPYHSINDLLVKQKLLTNILSNVKLARRYSVSQEIVWVSVNRGGRGGHPVKIQKWAKSNFYYCVGGKWPKRPKIAKLVTVKVGR